MWLLVIVSMTPPSSWSIEKDIDDLTLSQSVRDRGRDEENGVNDRALSANS
jgi:hypothetical protein